MKVKIAKKVGFCYGVNRAYNKTNILLTESNEKTYLFGELVHNKLVVNSLKDQGIKIFEDIKNLPDDSKESRVIIRAHGITLEERRILENNFKEIIDLTCPIVNRMTSFVREKQKEGYFVIVFGKETHPEMRGLKGSVDQQKIKITKVIQKEKFDKVCIASQTTVDNKSFKDFYLKYLKMNDFSDIIIKNTICIETSKREIEAEEISQWSDAVIVLGGKNSSNTKKLVNISKNFTQNTYHIEEINELVDITLNFEKIGILTGASTALWTLKDLTEYLVKNYSAEIID
ncbi:MAG: 4-hydroxy-3-methylbut-2-enyl diphosphate reductase [Thermotogota bacterium]